jgi:hydrogenase maturation protease
MKAPRILIAGIGNIFQGDDAFGVEVARRLLERPQRADVRIVDYGIRGLDLAYALMDGPELAILVDALPRGGAPGTLYVLDPDLEELGDDSLIDPHSMNPLNVLRMVQSFGATCPPLRIVGCEPKSFGSDEEPMMGLSQAVAGAVDEAIEIIDQLVKAFPDVSPQRVSPRPEGERSEIYIP